MPSFLMMGEYYIETFILAKIFILKLPLLKEELFLVWRQP